MLKMESERNKENIKTKKLKKEKSVDETKTKIINKIIDKIKTLVKESEHKEDETDRIGDKIKEIFQSILKEFEELIAKNKDKKYFISGVDKV